jgi:hypothetical protein
MREGNLFPFGVGGGVVEVDETYIGRDKTIKPDQRAGRRASRTTRLSRGSSSKRRSG